MTAPISAWAAGLLLLVHPAAAGASGFDLPAGPGRELVYGNCQTCHDLQSVVDSAGIRKGAWGAVLDNMKGFGLRLTDAQRSQILDYLGTYLGPNPPAQEHPAVAAAGSASGEAVFGNICIACHQPDGRGKGNDFPPLAGNPDLFLSREYPALVVLNGIAGPLQVEGRSFDSAMPSFASLSDAEVAAVIRYVRDAWGNGKLKPGDLGTLAAGDIAELRRKPLSPGEVHRKREELKGQAGH